MNLLAGIAAAVLAVLGALHLLSDLAERSDRPRVWLRQSSERRSFLLLVTSGVLGTVYGTVAHRIRKRQHEFQASVYELDVRLVQLQGLVSAALTSTTYRIPAPTAKSLESYVTTYSRRVFALVEVMKSRLNDWEYVQLRVSLGTIYESLRQMQMPEPGVPSPEALTDLLEAIGSVRRDIREFM